MRYDHPAVKEAEDSIKVAEYLKRMAFINPLLSMWTTTKMRSTAPQINPYGRRLDTRFRLPNEYKQNIQVASVAADHLL